MLSYKFFMDRFLNYLLPDNSFDDYKDKEIPS